MQIHKEETHGTMMQKVRQQRKMKMTTMTVIEMKEAIGMTKWMMV